MNVTRSTASLTVLGLCTASLLALTSAPAGADDRSSGSAVSLHASDTAVEPGEQVVLRGRFRVLVGPGSVPEENARIQVRTREDGAFVPVSGARVTTGADGRYRVRVVLSRTGERRLQVWARSASGYLRRSAVLHVQVG